MNFGLAFDKTIKKYGLKGNKIAAIAGVSPSMVSRFRGGSAINTDSLEKLLSVLDEEPLEYFLSHIASSKHLHARLRKPVALDDLVQHLNTQETVQLLYALAAKIREENHQ